METNFSTREVNIKIVYYGPGLSGKTTNLEVIHSHTPEDNRSRLTAVATDQDRTLFFDYMALELGEICGLKVRLKLFTVPGQVYYNATRKLVLRCVDGIIFVADSQEEKKQENLESLANLHANLIEYGLKLEDIPLIMQFNKRDLPNAMPLELMESILNGQLKAPWFPAVAVNGDGVFQCIKNIANMTLAKVEDNIKRRPSKVARPTEQMTGVNSEKKETVVAKPAERTKTPLPSVPLKPANTLQGAQGVRGRITNDDLSKRPNIMLNRSAASSIVPQEPIGRTATNPTLASNKPAGTMPPLFGNEKGSMSRSTLPPDMAAKDKGRMTAGKAPLPAKAEANTTMPAAKDKGRMTVGKAPLPAKAEANAAMPATKDKGRMTAGKAPLPAKAEANTTMSAAKPDVPLQSLVANRPASGFGFTLNSQKKQQPGNDPAIPFGNLFQGSLSESGPSRNMPSSLLETKTPATSLEAKRPLSPQDAKTPVTPPEAKRSLSPQDTKTPVTPPEAKRSLSPRDAKTPVTPPEAKRPLSPRDAKTPVTPPEAKRPLSPRDAKTPVTPPEAKRPFALFDGKKAESTTPAQAMSPVHEAANLEKWNEIKKSSDTTSQPKASGGSEASNAKFPMFTQQKVDEETKELKAQLKNLKKYKQMMGEDT